MTMAAGSPADLDARNRAQPAAAEPAGTGMRLVRLRLLRGCNLYHRRSVMTLQAELGPWAGRATAGLAADFAERFVERFDYPTRAIQSPALDPGFVARLRSPRGVPLEEALLAAVLATEAFTLDQMTVFDRVSFARAEKARRGSRLSLIWETSTPEMSRRAAAFAVAGFVGLIDDKAPSAAPEAFAAALAGLRRRAGRRELSLTTAIIRHAATSRRLPNETAGGRLTIGQGERQKHFYASLVEGISFRAVRLASDKRATSRRLRHLGLPVPRQIAVDSVEAARTAVERLGLPAVIKPRRGGQGRGVTPGIGSLADIDLAFERAEREGSGVVVEEFIRGSEYRLLVIGDRFVAASCRMPPRLTGDGVRTVRELVDELNADPRRDALRARRVAIDDTLVAFVAAQGCGVDDILEAGRTIALRAASNVHLGGMTVDVTDSVHPDNRRLAEHAAEGIGLDVAGVDFVTKDVGRSHREVGGAIIEINARPGLEIHALTYEGPPRAVGGALLEFAFPTDAQANIPKVVVAGDRGTFAVARETERRLRATGLAVGLVLRDAARANGAPIDVPAGKSNRAIRTLLRDPTIEALVCAMSPWTIVGRGLTLERCDVAAILPARHEAPSNTFMAGLEVLKAATQGSFVVRADDPVARTLLADVEPRRLVLVALKADDADAQRHLANGGRAVLKTWHEDGPRMVLVDGRRTLAAAPLKGDVRGARTQVALFALALAHAVRGHEPRAAGV